MIATLILISLLLPISNPGATVAAMPNQLADTVHTPAKGTPERQAIIDALRANYKKDTGDQVTFLVNYFKVHNGWAWIDATPLDGKNQPVAEGGTSLLHYDNDKWVIIDLSTVAEDSRDPMDSQDASPGFVRNLRKKYPTVPVDIFPSKRK